jgi:hypothetical protein
MVTEQSWHVTPTTRSQSGRLAPDIRLGQTEVIVLRDLEVDNLDLSASTTVIFDTPGFCHFI